MYRLTIFFLMTPVVIEENIFFKSNDDTDNGLWAVRQAAAVEQMSFGSKTILMEVMKMMEVVEVMRMETMELMEMMSFHSKMA